MSELLPRVAAQDQRAVRECVERYGDLVWSIALRLLRNRSDAEDVVQDIFLDLWRSAPRFDPLVASEATFVTMIARRRIYDRLRRQRRRPAPAEIDDIDQLGSRSGAERTEARLAARALEHLAPADRDVLLLAIHEGLTHREIATRTGMPLGTVKTRARRALIQLRELLAAPDAAAEESA